jgi:uncharacterized protein YkwD
MIGRARIAFLVACLALTLWQAPAIAVTLWIEGAENGYGEVIDNTAASYPLIQSDVVGKGTSAFHLANPSFQDNSFVIDETLPIQPDTKLFFLSRLRNATSFQFARVHVSTNGGSTWPTSIFNQAGSGIAGGESAFTLKEISLASFAGTNARFRFYYDFTNTSAVINVTSIDGWFVDDIQIGTEYQKTQWSIGNPTAYEQQYLEYVNRARADAMVEATRLRNETDSEILNAYSFFEIDPANIETQFQYHINNGFMDQHAQPLSFQAQLLQAAQLHTQDMFNEEFQGHSSSANPPAPFQPGYSLAQRLAAVGYDNISHFAENVYSNSESVRFGHAGFDVDWGENNASGAPGYNPAFNEQGMQNPPGHRFNIHNGDLREVGIGVINDTNGEVGPQLVTQDFGTTHDVLHYITGVVYEDLNSNSFYDIGEGRSGVRVDVDGSLFYAISTDSGGYSVPVSQNGTYDVLFSGGGWVPFETTATIASGQNEKIDYLASELAQIEGDYNNDGVVDAADYVVFRKGGLTTGTYATWRENFGESSLGSGGDAFSQASVPEPSAVVLASLFGTLILGVRSRSATPQPSL